ncbi:MAG: O-antigen ligase family protein [Pirellulaceae bacterium]
MEAIVAIFVGVGLVWGLLLALRGSLLLGCVAVLVATSVFGVFFMTFKLGINLSLDRLALVGLLAAFVLQWKLGKLEIRPWMTIDTIMALFFGVLIANTFMHDWRAAEPGQVPVVQHLINGYLIPLAIYIVARNLRYDERQTNWMLGGMVAFGVYLAIIGILEGTGQYGLVFPRYIADPELGLHFGRARGPMVQSVSYGVYVCGTMLCVWLLALRLPPQSRWLVFSLLPLFFAAIFFTKTRTVWLGGGLSLLAMVFLTMTGRARSVVIAGMVLVGVSGVIYKMDSILGLQREGTVTDTRRSVDMRASFTYVSLQMFYDKPLTGHGFSQFKKEKLPYLSDRNVDLLLESIRAYDHHNTYLSILTDLGLLGFIPFMAMYAWWGLTTWRLARRAAEPWARHVGTLGVGVLLIIACQMVGHEITFTPIDHLLVFFIAGMSVALAYDFKVMAATQPTAQRVPHAARRAPFQPSTG